MKRDRNEKRNFWLLLVLAVVAGLGFLVWGQYNTAATIFDLGFLRRNAAALMTSAEGVKLEEEEGQAAYDAMVSRGTEWAEGVSGTRGSWETESITAWFGENARIKLEYDFYTRDRDRTVILLHGFTQSAADVRYWAAFWWDRGWDVLIPQMRGDGGEESSGIPNTFGVYEQFDLYDLIRAAGLEGDTLVLQGRGAGAAAAVLLAANQDLTDAGVDGIVAESVYANMWADAQVLVKQLFGLGNSLIRRFLNYQIRTKLGFLPESVDLASAAADCRIPALFVCGEDDAFLDPGDTRTVYDAWGGEKQLALLRGGHRLLWAESETEYRQALGAFADNLA